MSYVFTKQEQKKLKNITETDYMKPALAKIGQIVNNGNSTNHTWSSIFDHLYRIMIESNQEVEQLLEIRQQQGEIKDKKQAIKSIAGNAFSNLILYVFLQNKAVGNIKPNAFITSNKSELKSFESIAVINVGEETQKPDADLVIWTENENADIEKCAILSLKTSLRERAGQTYKWKLLMEIANSDSEIRKKYDIQYNPVVVPYVCFATVNFYNEINNPQQRGMFKFFDAAFIGKMIDLRDNDFVKPLSTLIDFVNEKL